MEEKKYPEPTFKNWYEEVKKYFSKYEDSLSEQEVDRYLKSEEESIKDDYDGAVEAVKSGKITEGQFWHARVSAVANCLSLMYEPEEAEEVEEEPKLERDDKLF